jgi:transposase
MDNKYYLGIDLHRDSFTAFGTDDKGQEILKGKYQNNYDSINSLLAVFPTKPKVVVEATRNWMWFVQDLKTKGCHVTLAHPFKTKAIASARIKTDSIDAKTLCHLLRSDMVPPSYIATGDELEAREIVRARIQLVRDQTKTKNRIMAILGKQNLNFGGSDLFGAKGRGWLMGQRVTPAKDFVINLLLKRLDSLKEAIAEIDKIIKTEGSNSPAVCNLMSIPGIGAVTAYTILAEIGDIERFPTADKLTAYLGLVPRIDQSGTHTKMGRITKLGNTHVRWILVQAAHRIARTEMWAKRFVGKISRRGGKKKAIVASARKLAVIVYCVLKEQRQYYKL